MEFKRREILTTGHAIVNAIGIIALSSMHLWGNLGAEEATLGTMVICGLWWGNTRGGPPDSGPGPGVSGLMLGLAQTARHSMFPHA